MKRTAQRIRIVMTSTVLIGILISPAAAQGPRLGGTFADKVYYVWLPMWPRYIAHPSYVKGSLGSRLTHVWFER